MIIDKEEHREILHAAVKSMSISGPAGEPEMLRHVLMVHEILAAIDAATVTPSDAAREASLEMLASR